MSELDDIRSFVAVVESGGFGRAGQRLGLSKSIISRRIARLEADLGTRLLSRTTRGIAATEAGLEFKARGERILADLAEARDAVAQQSGGVVGRLRLSMPLTFGNRHVAPILGELARRHPGLELDVEASDRYVDLIGERFDAAIRIGTLKDSSLIARRIAPIHGVILASPAYLAARGRPATPARIEAPLRAQAVEMLVQPAVELGEILPLEEFVGDQPGMIAQRLAQPRARLGCGERARFLQRVAPHQLVQADRGG